MAAHLLQKILLFLPPLLAVFLVCRTSPYTLLVVEDRQTQCPRTTTNPCHTLQYYEQHTSMYFRDDTAMIFLNGTHILESSLPIMLINISNFTMIGSGNFTPGVEGLPESTSKINCTGSTMTGFYFNHAKDIRIENLTFISCGQKLEGAEIVRAAVAFYNVSDVNIIRTTVRNSTGYGVHMDSVFGRLMVRESAFLYNAGDTTYYGGNARFWYSDCPKNCSARVTIESSWFLHGSVMYKHEFYPMAPGIIFIIECPSVSVDINNVTVLSNLGDNGGNIAINLTDYGNNSVRISNSRIINGSAHRGGGLRIWSSMTPSKGPCGPAINSMQTVRVVNTLFSNNTAIAGGGAVYVSHYEMGHIQCTTVQVLFENCSFVNNHVPAKGTGAVMEAIKHKILGYQTHVLPQFEINFTSCSFSNNSLIVDEKHVFVGAILDVFSVDKILFRDCNFTYNKNTALSALNTNLAFEGNILFRGNHATNGGAIKFCDNSMLYIRNQTHVRFIDNHANQTGGAIYAPRRYLETATPCFFQPDVPDYTHITKLKAMMTLEFVNNTAAIAGDALYGGSVDECYTYNHFYWDGWNSYYKSGEIFNHIFNIEQQQGNTPVSSDPYGVCLCNASGVYNCSLKNNSLHPKKIFPGQTFNISVVAVGQRWGVVPALVEASLLENDSRTGSNHSIPKNYTIQKTKKTCVSLKFVVNSGAPNETITLKIQKFYLYKIPFYYEFSAPNFTVVFLPCPWGFTLDDDPPSCKCVDLLSRNGISCDIDHQKIQRPLLVWIGHESLHPEQRTPVPLATPTTNDLPREERTNSTQTDKAHTPVLFHAHCPFDYCQPHSVDITFETTDAQCANNRTGILCGTCKEGLSLLLGSSKCGHCTNLWIMLLLFFVLAGFLLVFLITGLNLTVSQGTINALVFYANVVQINSATFFPRLPDAMALQTLLKLPQIFIAWINLDLGIETCFYDGLDAYAKTWLQFAFPIYIWVIVGSIIYFSRKSALVARLFGKYAINVLATLFLLSYAKLGRTVITALSFTCIFSSEGGYRIVWLSDGNIEYLHGKHIPLFLIALLFGVLTLPYALVLTFIQCLRRVPRSKPLFWVRKLKPLFDAYTGPYKNKLCFWMGLLLLVRIILFVVFATNMLREPDLNLTMTAVACFALLALACAVGGIYRKWPLNVLESSFFLNLGILCVATNHVLHVDNGESQGRQAAITMVSVGIAFFTFVGICFYHLCNLGVSCRFTREAGRWGKAKWNQRWRAKEGMNEPMLGVVVCTTNYGITDIRQAIEGGEGEEREQGEGKGEGRGTMESHEELETTHEFPRNVAPFMTRNDMYREPVLEYEDI